MRLVEGKDPAGFPTTTYGLEVVLEISCGLE
jgi:hypothetical protein